MEKITDLNNRFEQESNERYDSFKIDDAVNQLSQISEDAYLEAPKWLGGSEKFVCLSIDLNESSVLSARKNPSTMAKLYDYFTQNIVDILNISDIKADYIDIKGDGVFGIYQEPKAIERAFIAAVTFRTFFDKVVKQKFKTYFDIDLGCKAAICKDNILVKKIGTRKYNNEVWAGRLVNNTYKTMSLSDSIKNSDKDASNNDLLIVSEPVFDHLRDNHKDYSIMSCGCPDMTTPIPLWSSFDVSEEKDVIGDKVFYLRSLWCSKHGDEFLEKILNS